METNRAERLKAAIAALNELIALTQGCDLHESTQFLAMARLQLLIDLNEVSDAEFRALCELAEDKKQARSGRRNATPARTLRNGRLQAMRRARLSQDPPAGHVRRKRARP